MDKISAMVEDWLLYKGNTKEQLAKAVGISIPTIAVRLENPSGWTVGEISNLAAFFNVPVSELLKDIK